jgi:excisionase family DNA binding protein
MGAGGHRGAGGMTELLTLNEVADRLRVSTRTVRRLVASGQIRVVKIARRTLVKASEVDAYVAAASRRAA